MSHEDGQTNNHLAKSYPHASLGLQHILNDARSLLPGTHAKSSGTPRHFGRMCSCLAWGADKAVSSTLQAALAKLLGPKLPSKLPHW